MEKEKNKNDTRKNLSEFKIRLKMLEFLAFVDSVKRFELTNGRKPTQGERKDIAKISHISIDDFCDLIEEIYPEKFPIASVQG